MPNLGLYQYGLLAPSVRPLGYFRAPFSPFSPFPHFRMNPKDDVGPTGLPDPAVGAQNVTSLIGDALVAGIVGPLTSSAAKAEMPIANPAPIALISPAN